MMAFDFIWQFKRGDKQAFKKAIRLIRSLQPHGSSITEEEKILLSYQLLSNPIFTAAMDKFNNKLPSSRSHNREVFVQALKKLGVFDAGKNFVIQTISETKTISEGISAAKSDTSEIERYMEANGKIEYGQALLNPYTGKVGYDKLSALMGIKQEIPISMVDFSRLASPTSLLYDPEQRVMFSQRSDSDVSYKISKDGQQIKVEAEVKSLGIMPFFGALPHEARDAMAKNCGAEANITITINPSMNTYTRVVNIIPANKNVREGMLKIFGATDPNTSHKIALT